MAWTGPENPFRGAIKPEMSDEQILEAVATRIVRMGLSAPAIFFFESSKPLAYVGSQALIFFEPFVKTFLNVAHYQRFARLLEDRENVERLILRVEDLDERAQDAEREAKRMARAERPPRRNWVRTVWHRLRGRSDSSAR